MKKIAVISLGLALLAGCSTTQVGWEQDNQIVVDKANIQLESNLWLNKMPTIGEMQEQALHGALVLEASDTLPADLDVTSISLRQGDETWLIEGDLLELRSHSENRWEISFVWQFDFDSELPIDVAVMINNGDDVEWLVEKDVNIDTVY
ncbi:hypothetical protein [Vibrio renipiscarius]|uniref:DNA polymerase III subunit beta n=1 Tax=Vibrio renipiscarius TaxID=1461322 RepID=A0A0C2P4K9_9VIBR|nr:hypothetical protein [Vibrio renipiscarius]KII77445.1 DNA polymerase III subunit beta [Vibrio renipiscarius]KII81387.1 DNA polymerase III subunit beta [Vibrio renipiscarius]